jgi:hypothetical protein
VWGAMKLGRQMNLVEVRVYHRLGSGGRHQRVLRDWRGGASEAAWKLQVGLAILS